MPDAWKSGSFLSQSGMQHTVDVYVGMYIPHRSGLRRRKQREVSYIHILREASACLLVQL